MTIRVKDGTLRRVTSTEGQKISFVTNDVREIDKLFERVEGKPLTVDFKVYRQKRSLDANAYMWVLCEKIAKRIGGRTEREDVYREAIRHVGVFTDVAVMTKALSTLIDGWEAKGIGYFAENFDSPLKGCRRVRLYVGSHVYDTEEMSRLIDYIVDEADGLDIETKTPDELARMKADWENYR